MLAKISHSGVTLMKGVRKMISVKDAALRLGMSREALGSLIRLGAIKGTILSRAYILDDSEVERFARLNGLALRNDAIKAKSA